MSLQSPMSRLTMTPEMKQEYVNRIDRVLNTMPKRLLKGRLEDGYGHYCAVGLLENRVPSGAFWHGYAYYGVSRNEWSLLIRDNDNAKNNEERIESFVAHLTNWKENLMGGE